MIYVKTPAEEYTDEAPAYILKNGEQELAVLTFSGSELDWDVSEVEMRLTGKEEASLEVPENCTVYCNGKALEEPYISDKALGECDRTFPYQVPDSRYFLMGDHRATSVDSRSSVVGCVAQEQIVGKILFSVWPLDTFGKID